MSPYFYNVAVTFVKLLASSVLMSGINSRRLANTRFERIIVICIKYSPLKGNFVN